MPCHICAVHAHLLRLHTTSTDAFQKVVLKDYGTKFWCMRGDLNPDCHMTSKWVASQRGFINRAKQQHVAAVLSEGRHLQQARTVVIPALMSCACSAAA